MKKYYIYITLAACLMTVSFVIGDYFSLFGTTEQLKTGFTDIQFKITDDENDMLVNDVHVRCIQKMNENACGQRDSNDLGMVYIKVPMRTVVTRSLLFDQGEVPVKTEDPKLHIWFIHPDYESFVQSFEIMDLYNNNGGQYTINMQPRTEDQE